ncbi:MAG: response regulator [Lachnospiraceae bacterium]|nr:response regulator [Lachnospiraceae bacterium]
MKEEAKLKMLVVDDGPVEGLFIKRVLEGCGVEADLADGGAEGIKKAAKKDYDLILLDDMMPYMDGSDTYSHIRSDYGSLSHESQVLIFGDASDREEYRGVAGFISKPARPGDLFHKLREIMPEDKFSLIKLPGLPQREGENADNSQNIDKKEKREGIERAEKAIEKPSAEELLMENGGDSSAMGLGDALVRRLEAYKINWEEGLRYCGSEEGYMEALRIYWSTIAQKSDEIDGFFEGRDIENYTIKVHALKSSSRLVGATDLSNRALELEMAGKSGNWELIEEKNGGLLSDYREYKKVLDSIFVSEKEKPDIDEDMLKDAYSSLYSFAEQMDFSLTEMVLKSLDEYTLPKGDKEIIDDIKQKSQALDWEGVKAALSGKQGDSE